VAISLPSSVTRRREKPVIPALMPIQNTPPHLVICVMGAWGMSSHSNYRFLSLTETRPGHIRPMLSFLSRILKLHPPFSSNTQGGAQKYYITLITASAFFPRVNHEWGRHFDEEDRYEQMLMQVLRLVVMAFLVSTFIPNPVIFLVDSAHYILSLLPRLRKYLAILDLWMKLYRMKEP
jgi:hypothetical protein